MVQWGYWLLTHVFTALLPPQNDTDSESENDRDYYDVLGLSKTASLTEIRAAYKQKSLQWHPDKVAQRQLQQARRKRQQGPLLETNKDDIDNTKIIDPQQEYQAIQEAHTVLSHASSRDDYHALQCSPVRYRFVKDGGLAHPGNLYMHLTNASLQDKSRLVGVVGGLIMVGLLLQPILLASKTNHEVRDDRDGTHDSSSMSRTPWTVVLLPTWLLGGTLWIAATLLIIWPLWNKKRQSRSDDSEEDQDGENASEKEETDNRSIWTKLPITLLWLQALLWGMTLFVLAHVWDKRDVDDNWKEWSNTTLFPLYLAILVGWIRRWATMRQLRYDMARMVTLEWLESTLIPQLFGKGDEENATEEKRSVEDLTEAESMAIQEQFLIVTVPPDVELEPYEAMEDETEEQVALLLEAQKVESSLEFQAAAEAYGKTINSLLVALLIGIPFWCAVSFQLVNRSKDNGKNVSWWVIFIPIWIQLAFQLITSCLGCMCAAVALPVGMAEPPTMANETSDAKENGGDNAITTSEGVEVSATGSTVAVPKESSSKSVTKDSSSKSVTKESSSKSVTKESSSNSVTKDASSKSVTKDASSKSVQQGDDEEAASPDANDDDDDVDPETFERWKAAYAQAEQAAIESQSKAAMNCCLGMVKLMMLCLVVAKLQDATDKDTDDPGFNTLWILFPVFMACGLVLCCCACLIYGAAPGTMADFAEATGGPNAAAASSPDGNDVEKGDGGGDSPIILAPPPPASSSSEKTTPLPPTESYVHDDDMGVPATQRMSKKELLSIPSTVQEESSNLGKSMSSSDPTPSALFSKSKSSTSQDQQLQDEALLSPTISETPSALKIETPDGALSPRTIEMNTSSVDSAMSFSPKSNGGEDGPLSPSSIPVSPAASDRSKKKKKKKRSKKTTPASPSKTQTPILSAISTEMEVDEAMSTEIAADETYDDMNDLD